MSEKIAQLIATLIAAAAIGIGAGYVTSTNNLSINSNDLKHISQDMAELKTMMLIVNDNQLETAKIQERMLSNDRRLMNIEQSLSVLSAQSTLNYPRSEAKKDFDFLLNQIKTANKNK